MEKENIDSSISSKKKIVSDVLIKKPTIGSMLDPELVEKLKKIK